MFLWTYRATPRWCEEHLDALETEFVEQLAVVEIPGKITRLVQVTCSRRARANSLAERFGGGLERLPADWQKQFLHSADHAPLRIGNRLVVLSEARDRNRSQLVIPAAGAFGTGEHATTAMSLRLLEQLTRKLPPGWRLLDAGTGTGILALAARRLDADDVKGVDLDRRAVAHARANARLNHITRAKFEVADVLQWQPTQHFDVITANLFSELLIAALPRFRHALRARGILIVSGILHHQAREVITALERAKFVLDHQRRRGKWVALAAHLGARSKS